LPQFSRFYVELRVTVSARLRMSLRNMKQLTEPELKALMLLSLDGDEVAYRCLLDMLRHLLVNYYGRRLARSVPADVDDLVQETLLALHQRRITYDRGRPFTAWFFTIARHKLVDHYRRAGGRAHVGTEILEEMADGYSEDAVSAGMDVNRLLAGLPAWQGEMIRQVRLEGHSVADTAMRSGRSEAVVKISVFRGIKAMAAKLRGEHSEDG
jgi:RNA polymerase sigma-70 factor, ECF subfamily